MASFTWVGWSVFFIEIAVYTQTQGFLPLCTGNVNWVHWSAGPCLLSVPTAFHFRKVYLETSVNGLPVRRSTNTHTWAYSMYTNTSRLHSHMHSSIITYICTTSPPLTHMDLLTHVLGIHRHMRSTMDAFIHMQSTTYSGFSRHLAIVSLLRLDIPSDLFFNVTEMVPFGLAVPMGKLIYPSYWVDPPTCDVAIRSILRRPVMANRQSTPGGKIGALGMTPPPFTTTSTIYCIL